MGKFWKLLTPVDTRELSNFRFSTSFFKILKYFEHLLADCFSNGSSRIKYKA